MSESLKGPAFTDKRPPQETKVIVAPTAKAPSAFKNAPANNPVPAKESPKPATPSTTESKDDVVAQAESEVVAEAPAPVNTEPAQDTRVKDLTPSPNSQDMVTLSEQYKDDYYETGVPIGLESLDANDVTAAEWRIVQNTSNAFLKEHPGTVGKLYHTTEGQVVDELEVIIVSVSKSRSNFNDELTGPKKCFSYDAIKPHGGDLYSRDDNVWCDSCPHARGECKFMYDYMLVIPSQAKTIPIPSKFSCHGGSLPVASSLNWFLKSKGVSPYHHVFKITTKLKDWKKGSSYQPVFEKVRESSDEEKAVCRQMALQVESQVRRLKQHV